MSSYKVINLGMGPRFFHGSSGTITLDPMGLWKGNLTDAELSSLQENKDFNVTVNDDEDADLFKSSKKPKVKDKSKREAIPAKE